MFFDFLNFNYFFQFLRNTWKFPIGLFGFLQFFFCLWECSLSVRWDKPNGFSLFYFQVYGLHENADITKNQRETLQLFEGILQTLPRQVCNLVMYSCYSRLPFVCLFVLLFLWLAGRLIVCLFVCLFVFLEFTALVSFKNLRMLKLD